MFHIRQLTFAATPLKKFSTFYRRKSFRIGLVPGDGIGKEVVPAARKVIEAVAAEKNLSFDFEDFEAGFETFQKHGTSLPEETVSGLKKCHGAIFGAVSSPSHKVEGYSSPIVALRKKLDLYANVRPCTSSPLRNPPPGSQDNIDLVIVRENTEDLYVKRERLEDSGKTAIAEKVITEYASTRIAQLAYRLSVKRNKNQSPMVTIVHKSNVMSVSDGLFRDVCLRVAKQFPNVKTEEQLVDSMLYRLIREPSRYDVIVAPNLYGDILSDGAAALVGGLGLCASANQGDTFIMGEPVHGSAPDIEGKGVANPLACIRAAAILLEGLVDPTIPRAINNAVLELMKMEREYLTPDLGGSSTTDKVTRRVIDLALKSL